MPHHTAGLVRGNLPAAYMVPHASLGDKEPPAVGNGVSQANINSLAWARSISIAMLSAECDSDTVAGLVCTVRLGDFAYLC